ncbi:unnamed protein product [Brassicogethes aeneus]|uniref:Solute carrier family 25 member 46 n=1 Tax=Brassicogethes aeneus TaxID=1431903 RepID=A0A9P0BDP2_BRAAE|nr:unnamed protein product [Brassicogethes aeneus]
MAGQNLNNDHLKLLNFAPNMPEKRVPPPRRRLLDPEEEALTQEYLTRMRNRPPIPPHQDSEEVAIEKYIGSGVAFVSLVAENLLSHPFIVLRRQCQVHHVSQKYHILPFTLLPAVLNLHTRQGLTTLWKGLGSVLLVRGMTLGVEDLVSKATPWPKEIRTHCSLKHFFQHTLLKCVSLAIVTPFYSASFVETVQSEIASESPGCLDVFREGFMRLLNWGAPAKGRMLPIWALIVPTVTLGVAKYLFGMAIKGAAGKLLHARFRNRHEEQGAFPKDLGQVPTKQDVELTSSIVAAIITDIVFFPCETVVHRLHLQGTRTIVDNLDNGRSVLPILTNYSGPIDCYESCIATEGNLGLYKGFGALVLQYIAHIALIRVSHFLLSELGGVIWKQKKVPPPQDDPNNISPPAISNLTIGRRSYLLP